MLWSPGHVERPFVGASVKSQAKLPTDGQDRLPAMGTSRLRRSPAEPSVYANPATTYCNPRRLQSRTTQLSPIILQNCYEIIINCLMLLHFGVIYYIVTVPRTMLFPTTGFQKVFFSFSDPSPLPHFFTWLIPIYFSNQSFVFPWPSFLGLFSLLLFHSTLKFLNVVGSRVQVWEWLLWSSLLLNSTDPVFLNRI